jgi:hypothetical protein
MNIAVPVFLDEFLEVWIERLLGVRRPGAAFPARGARNVREKRAALRAGPKRRQAAALQGDARYKTIDTKLDRN